MKKHQGYVFYCHALLNPHNIQGSKGYTKGNVTSAFWMSKGRPVVPEGVPAKNSEA